MIDFQSFETSRGPYRTEENPNKSHCQPEGSQKRVRRSQLHRSSGTPRYVDSARILSYTCLLKCRRKADELIDRKKVVRSGERLVSEVLNEEPEREFLAGTRQLRNGIVQFAQGVRQEPELPVLAHVLFE